MRRSEGFTLIEVTVLLAVIGMLFGLMAGSAGDLLQQSRTLRARDDVEQIGRAIVGFYGDTGFFPRTEDTVAGRPGTLEVGSLYSGAALPEVTDSAALWERSRIDLMSAHLTRNLRGYHNRDPLTRRGWAGPYVPAGIGADPWGHAYVVNVFYLDPSDVIVDIDGTSLGAVYSLSAGPNGVLETPFYQPRDNAVIYGDDIGYRLQ